MGIWTREVRAGAAAVNGTELYHEVRGDGPALMLIPGATGDAGHFERAAELLRARLLGTA